MLSVENADDISKYREIIHEQIDKAVDEIARMQTKK